MNSFWSLWVIILTTITVILILWILIANRKTKQRGPDQKTGHEYDGIEEYDNPLPAWWMYMFLLSILFSIGYLIAYPGMGNFKGMLDWTQEKQYENEVKVAEEDFLAAYNAFDDKSIEGLATNEKAVRMGQRLFANNCTVCHGADARGTKGFPDLGDKDWLYGGNAERIRESITQGRRGMMPAWGPVLGTENTHAVASYVKALSEGQGEAAAVSQGKQVYASYCAACHGVSGEGSEMLGAPRLNDGVWLYGGSVEAITASVTNGRSGQMPAHGEVLSEERIQLISAYIYSLNR